MRNIQHVLLFRTDISPFLVHLTRMAGDTPAKDVLGNIIMSGELMCGNSEVSDARFGMKTFSLNTDNIKRYFSAICFTETPLSEVHCLLEIDNRQVELEPYGLVFLKEALSQKGVSPVLYINNQQGGKEEVFKALCSLIKSHAPAAAELLPLLSAYGQKLRAPGYLGALSGENDWRWEREWRLPSARGPLPFDAEDVFVGLCPHEEIDHFEALFPGIGFIDPRRTMKWYAAKLIAARQRLDLKYAVV